MYGSIMKIVVEDLNKKEKGKIREIDENIFFNFSIDVIIKTTFTVTICKKINS